MIVHDAAFNDLSRIEQHKLIYAALDEPWKQGNIHVFQDQHERDSSDL